MRGAERCDRGEDRSVIIAWCWALLAAKAAPRVHAQRRLPTPPGATPKAALKATAQADGDKRSRPKLQVTMNYCAVGEVTTRQNDRIQLLHDTTQHGHPSQCYYTIILL